jgi:hypothetical protein
MRAGEFFTWSRAVNIGIVDGRIPAEEMQQRTLGVTYTDRDAEFDHIEWELDNRDGMLTQPEYIALGLIVRLQLGYADGVFPWKAFIINRVRGGVGVYGRPHAAVGDNESKVTFFGRNRNAPGGRAARGWRKTATPPSKKPPKSYPATIDITAQEMLLGSVDQPRAVFGDTTAAIVEAIAARNGFQGSFALIEPTNDPLDGGMYSLKPGISDMQALQILAAERGWVCKIDPLGLHWHSKHWAGAKHQIVDSLIYGSTPDILQLTIDCDFRLPVPNAVKAEGYSYQKRLGQTYDPPDDVLSRTAGEANLGLARLDWADDPGRKAALTRRETISVVSDSAIKSAKVAQQHFVQRHTRAFQINLETVGNPKLLAARLLQLSGTGNPLVDRALYIKEARHLIGSNDYRTQLMLTHPPKRYAGSGPTHLGQTYDKTTNPAAGSAPRIGVTRMDNWIVKDKSKSVRSTGR